MQHISQPGSSRTPFTVSGVLAGPDRHVAALAVFFFCRQHIGVTLRDAGLSVHDINTYMARFRPRPRSPTDKGHPEGPRVKPHVKPRQDPAAMDNSLRTLDIQGARWESCLCLVLYAVCSSRDERMFPVLPVRQMVLLLKPIAACL